MKKGVCCIAVCFFLATSGLAAIPVTDGANLIHNITQAVEDVKQTMRQIEQYRLQIQQYENDIKNTKSLPDKLRIATDAAVMVGKFQRLMDTLAGQKATLGSLDASLRQFKTADQWRATNPKDDIVWERNQGITRDTNERILRGNDQQMQALQDDAVRLDDMQKSLMQAQGQVEAMQAQGQIAAAQTNQMMLLRAQLLSQANAQALQEQARADEDARQRVLNERLTRTDTVKTRPNKGF